MRGGAGRIRGGSSQSCSCRRAGGEWRGTCRNGQFSRGAPAHVPVVANAWHISPPAERV